MAITLFTNDYYVYNRHVYNRVITSLCSVVQDINESWVGDD